MKKLLSILLIIAVLVYLYAAYLGIKGLHVHEYVIESDAIPNNYNGFTIAHFSDLLYGSTVNIDDVKKMVDKINSYDPDVIVFSGNLITDEKEISDDDTLKLAEALKELKAKQKKIAITSALDSSKNDRYVSIMDKARFSIIDNKSISFFRGGNTPIQIAGITDFSKVTETLETDTEPFYTIAIIHESDDAGKLTNYDIDTVLAGNSLGGLIKVPGYGPILKQDGSNNYIEGKYELTTGMNLYVSTGLGTRKYHYRFFNKPSINIYKLYNKAD
jgi:hypothetical protein